MDACPRCGLARAHRDSVAVRDLPPELAADWDRVVERWEEAAPHAIFLERCAAASALDLAASLYRPFLADDGRSARARASLDRIVALAQQSLAREATPASKVARNRRIALVIAIIVSGGLLLVMAFALVANARGG